MLILNRFTHFSGALVVELHVEVEQLNNDNNNNNNNNNNNSNNNNVDDNSNNNNKQVHIKIKKFFV